MNIQRVKYIFKRLNESPISFLIEKAKIEIFKAFFHSQNSFLLKKTIKKEFIKLKKVKRERLELTLKKKELQYLCERVQDYANGYPCLGYGRVDIYSEGTFSKDCIHNFKWSGKESSFKIDFIKQNIKCDVKIPWEKSRLQWLTEKAILCVHSECDLENIYSHLNRWYSENPINQGVNWVSSMEVAIRAINLVIILKLTEHFENKELNNLLLKSIAEHSAYLKLYPEISDIPGNHYLATEVGMAVIMQAQGQSYNINKMEHILEQQFPNSGMHLEYSTIYNRLCVDLALFGLASIKGGLDDVNRERITSLIDSVTVFSSEKALLPIFGDSDSGQVLNFGQSSRDASLYITTVNHTESISILKQLLVAINPAVKKILSNYKLSDKTHTIVYPFHIFQKDNFKLITRFGGAGLMGRAPHDHDDVMSFWVFKNGEDLIVERGCAPYTSDQAKRIELISKKSHNSIIIGNNYKNLNDGSVFKTVSIEEANFNITDDNHFYFKLEDVLGTVIRSFSLERNKLKIVDKFDMRVKMDVTRLLFLCDSSVEINCKEFCLHEELFFTEYGQSENKALKIRKVEFSHREIEKSEFELVCI